MADEEEGAAELGEADEAGEAGDGEETEEDLDEEGEGEEAPLPEPNPDDEAEEAPPKPVRVIPDTRHSVSPRILPEFRNICGSEENIHQAKKTDLTDENVLDYAGTTSLVGWKGRVDYALDYLEKGGHLDAKLLAHLIECVVSCVILMASGSELDSKHLVSAVTYLRYVHNEFGKHPKNIAGLLEYIGERLSPEVLEEFKSIGNPEADDLPPNVTIIQIPSDIQEKVCKQK